MVRFLLLPFALLYGLAVIIRNFMFNQGLLKSVAYSKPVIGVGNLNVGGTGKTPHVEYLIRLLQDDFAIATLSRGYKRSSKGFMLADENSTAELIGDEPTQFKFNFDQVKVAVDEKRARGIGQLLKNHPQLDVILLDDAYQHRWVRPGLSILLTDFRLPYYRDFLLPVGRLREPKREARRADVIVVTKSPKVLSPIERRLILEKIKPRPYQKVFFSYLKFNDLLPLNGLDLKPAKKHHYGILAVTGIANPVPMEEFLSRRCTELLSLHFGDHHKYTLKDIRKIKDEFESILSRDKIIVTTEKDSMRLQSPEILDALSTLPVYYVPVRSEMNRSDKQEYDEMIHNYVRQTTRNP